MRLRSKDFPFPHYGLVSGHIEIDLTEPRRPMQRHIWKREDGTKDVEQWIDTIRDTAERLLARGWRRIP